VVDVISVPELAALLGDQRRGRAVLLASEKLTGYADTDAAAVRGR